MGTSNERELIAREAFEEVMDGHWDDFVRWMARSGKNGARNANVVKMIFTTPLTHYQIANVYELTESRIGGIKRSVLRKAINYLQTRGLK